MKRHPALVPLSHDHHEALVVARKLIRATATDAAEAFTALNAYWSADGEAHFRAEEAILFPAYARHCDRPDPLVAEALRDHDAIRERVEALHRAAVERPSDLSELGGLLERHVRLEERELFPRIEAAIPAAELADVADALARATASRRV